MTAGKVTEICQLAKKLVKEGGPYKHKPLSLDTEYSWKTKSVVAAY